MKINFSIILALLAAPYMLSTCRESNFSGSPVAPNKPATTKIPVTNPDGTTTPSDPIVEDQGIIKGDCNINVAYDPTSVNCALPIAGNNIWTRSPTWSGAVNQFSNKSATWISPLAASSSGSESFCPSIPSNDKLIYVSYFKVATAGDFSFEVINDNTGRLAVWKNADPTQEVISLSTPDRSISRQTKDLKPGHYSIILESQDFGTASAAVLSVKGPSGEVVKQTASDNTWCIFRTSAATVMKDFIPGAAACRPCFVGK